MLIFQFFSQVRSGAKFIQMFNNVNVNLPSFWAEYQNAKNDKERLELQREWLKHSAKLSAEYAEFYERQQRHDNKIAFQGQHNQSQIQREQLQRGKKALKHYNRNRNIDSSR